MPRNVQMYFVVIVLLAPPLFLVHACEAYAFVGEPYYIRTGHCKEHNVCVYTYETVLIHSVDIQSQNITVSVTFEVSCNSKGEYAYHKATKYCLSVTESFLEHEGSSGSVTTDLGQLLLGWFCFVQMDNGKIPIVLHPQNESLEIINFKKGLVSGFQANFEGTKEVEETDPESIHMSYYRYIVQPEYLHPSGHMIRHFTQRDIAITATKSAVGMAYSKEEEIQYNDGVLSHAHGETHAMIPYNHRRHRTHIREEDSTQESILNNGREIGSRRPQRRVIWGVPGQYHHQNAQSFYPSLTLDQFSVHSTYTLDLVNHFSSAERVSRKRREIQESISEGYTATSLEALINHENDVFSGLQQLNVVSILEHIHHHPDDTDQMQLLKKYLSMESTNSAVTAEIVQYFNNIRLSNEQRDIAMRLKMYAILSLLATTSHDAQEALLLCVEDVTDVTEWNNLLMNIALKVTPCSEFVMRLQSLIDTNRTRDSNAVLLVYGALASRADFKLQAEMVAYLCKHLQNTTENINDLIALVNALGNTGAEQTIDILLDLIDYNTLEIQLTVISALRKQTNNIHVLTAFLNLLNKTTTSVKVVGAIANTLITGVEMSGVANEQVMFDIAKVMVSSSKALNNTYIYELVSYYLHLLRQYDRTLGRRLRRDIGNWISSGPEYDMIASYEERQDDGIKYPRHNAYLWSKQIGVKNFNMQVASGMFTGANEDASDQKILGRTVAKVNAFGQSATAIEIEALRAQSMHDGVHKVVYVTLGGYVLLNFEASADYEEAPMTYGNGMEYPIIEINWGSFVTVASISTQMIVYAQIDSYFAVDASISNRENSFLSRGLLSPSLIVRLEGSSIFDVMGTQGEIGLDGVIGYTFEAEGSISGCTYGPPALTVQTTIKDGWPRGYINQASWLRTWQTAPCGFEQCIWMGDKVQDSEPIERWVLQYKSSERIWSDYLYSGPDRTHQVCPAGPEISTDSVNEERTNSDEFPGSQMPSRPYYRPMYGSRPFQNPPY